MTAYYNEIDPYCAQWLRNLMDVDLIAKGDVDTRSIKEVRPEDVRGYKQVHLFAGIGGWSYALRLAEWPDDKPIWTGSCPCQPFSVAGKGAGFNDPRHLWPDMLRLCRAERPAVIMGEQVSGALGYDWFDGVASDLEGEGYQARAVDIPACSVGAPHIRPRLYWFANTYSDRYKSQKVGDTCTNAEQYVATSGQERTPISYATCAGVEPSWKVGLSNVCKFPRMDDGIFIPVDALRAFGNAIVPPLAAEVIRAWMECEPC